MTIPGQSLTSFVPALLARRLASSQGTPDRSSTERIEAAVLGMDISDSTALTEDLATRGTEGPEWLASVLNGVFGLVAEEIVARSGSVVTLAGDEVVALWLASDCGGLEAAVHRAASAALAVRERSRTLPAAGGHPIRMRTGVGAGTAYLMDIGRGHGRRLFLTAGPAFQEMAAAQRAVAPAEIALGASARALLGQHVTAEDTGGGVWRMQGSDTGWASPAESPPVMRSDPPVDDALIARYLPDSVFQGLRGGGLRAELSPVTVAFVTLRTGPWSPEACVQVTQACLQTLGTLATYDGTLVSARQDIEGVTLLAGFGLPPVVREHEAARAAMCALEITAGLKGYMEHGVGIATGHAFCGVFGTAAYRQSTVAGPVANLAARLMQRAQNEVLCDEATQRLSRERLRFSARGAIEAKGIRGPVEVYRPEWHEADPGAPALKRLAARPRDRITRGRERERQALAGRLVALSLGTSTAVVVQGDPGAGKTHLAIDLLEASEGYGRIVTLVGGGDEMDRRPYHAWRPVLTQALGLAGVRDPAERAAAVTDRLATSPAMAGWGGLLNDLLDLNLDDEPVRDMTGSARRENTIRVLVHLLVDATAGNPVLLVLDDCHWMDSASWELVRSVHRDVAPLMLALFSRSVRAGEVAHYLRSASALWLDLEPLAPEATEAIARDVLAADFLDTPLRGLFRDKVSGSPLFAVELAFQLRADEVVAVDKGVEGSHARLAIPEPELERLRLPLRVEEVFRARLSALTDHQRAVIRAASVVGSTFDAKRVLGADPELDAGTLGEDLHALTRMNVIEAAGDRWRFQHALIRDVALQSSLPSELRQRHRALAGWYERHRPSPDTYAIVARHWQEAGDAERQMEYLEAAAVAAFMRGAEEETIAHTRAALQVDERQSGELEAVTDARRAFWHGQIGEALAARNRLDEAVDSLGSALRLVGQRVPRTTFGWALRVVREILRQVAHLLVPDTRLARRDGREGPAQAAELFGMLAEAQYFRSDGVAWIACNLAAVNLAESAGDVGLAGRAYAGLGNFVGTMRFHRLARRYFRRARQEALTQRHGTTSHLTLEAMPALNWEHDITTTVSESVYLRTMNRATDVLPALDDVVARLREAGLNNSLEIALAVRGFLHCAAGALHPARADFEELVSSARRRSNADHLTWGLTLLVPVLLALDLKAEALRADEEAAGVYSDANRLSGPNFHGSHVQALVARGATADALRYASRASRALGGAPVFFHLTGLTAMVEACLDVLETVRGRPEERAARQAVRRALRTLRRYARLYPFARARYQLHAGRYLALRGRGAAARRRWTRGVRLAEDRGLELDAARMHTALAAGLADDDPQRADHLRRAQRTLSDLGLTRTSADTHGRAA